MYKDPTKYSSITFCIDDYKWNNSDEVAKVEMWKDISTQLQLLLKNGYTTLVRDDDTDIIVIEYENDENKRAWGCDNPYWLTAEEWEKISDARYTEDDEDYWDGPKVTDDEQE